MNQYFTYEATDETGKTEEVAKNELNPYHQWFQYDRFLFLLEKKCLPISGFGYTSKYQIKMQLDTINPLQLTNFEITSGKNQYDERKREKFNAFIKIYFTNRNEHGNSKFFLRYLSPPHHLNNCVSGGGLNALGKIKTFRVIYNVTLNKDGMIIPFTKQIVDEIHI